MQKIKTSRTLCLFLILTQGMLLGTPFFAYAEEQGFVLEEDFFVEESLASLVDDYSSQYSENDPVLHDTSEVAIPPPDPDLVVPPIPASSGRGGSKMSTKTPTKGLPKVIRHVKAPLKSDQKKPTDFPLPSFKNISPLPFYSSSPILDDDLKKNPIPGENDFFDRIIHTIFKRLPKGSQPIRLSFETPAYRTFLESISEQEREKLEKLFEVSAPSENIFNMAYPKDRATTTSPSPLPNYISLSLYEKLDEKIEGIKNLCFALLLGVLTLLFFQLLFFYQIRKEMAMGEKKGKVKRKKFGKTLTLFFVTSLFFGMFFQEDAFASPTQTMRYQGRLRLEGETNYAQGSYVFRMSFWNYASTQSGDFMNGTINPNALNYKGWQEEIPTTIRQGGYFSVVLGAINPIPNNLFQTTNGLFLQIEVRKATNGSNYLLIDSSADPTENRRGFTAVPYAKNSERLDGHGIGFAAKQVPYLNDSALLPSSAIPGGTDQKFFIIDANNQAGANENIVLKFGEALSKTLLFNKQLVRFEFNDTVSITGDLLITGSLNGTTIGVKNENTVLSPLYPNAVFIADGSGNTGSMYENSEEVSGKTIHVLQWKSAQQSLQDYTTVISFSLPANFKQFRTPALKFLYKAVGDALLSKVDFVVEKKTAPGNDLLAGTGMGLSASSWTESSFPFPEESSFSAGESLVFKIKTYSKEGNIAQIGDIVLQYETQ